MNKNTCYELAHFVDNLSPEKLQKLKDILIRYNNINIFSEDVKELTKENLNKLQNAAAKKVRK